MIYSYKDECFYMHSDISVSNHNSNKLTPSHTHSFFEIAYIYGGNGFQIINEKRIPVTKGDYFFLDTTVSHCYDGNVQVLNLIFKPAFLDKTYHNITTISQLYNKILANTNFSISVPEPLYHTYTDDGNIVRKIERIQNELNNKSFGYEKCAQIALQEIITHSVRSIVCKNSENDNIRFIKEYIYEHYNEDISLKLMSDIMGYSSPYISKVFHTATGKTFSEYLQITRIEFARSILINNPRLSINEVSNMVGYKNAKQFTAVFKKHTGTTPRIFCKSVKE